MKFMFLITLMVAVSVSVPTDVSLDTTTLYPSSTEVVPTYDYVVEIGFNLNEEKVPEYLVNIIYNEASQKSITTDDIFTLYGLKTIDRLGTLDFLAKMNISSEKIFCLDGFDKFLTELRVDFKEYYNRVIISRLNITGNPLRNLLVTLNIDINNFSMGMAYGDPNPYEEFKKGTFTKESVTSAFEQANSSLDELFIATRDEYVSKAISFKPEKIVESLLKYNFDKTAALDLWNVLGLNMKNVYSIPAFTQLLNELSRELNKIPCLGVLTGTNNITINKKVYDNWSDEKDVVRPFAQSITHKFILEIIQKVDTELENILLLKASGVEAFEDELDVTYIDIGKTNKDLHNCKFITLQNESIIVRDVSRALSRMNVIHIPKEDVSDLILGSPLVCENKVYGLAREIRGDEIILDSFSGVNRIVLDITLLSIAIVACIGVYFL